MYNILFRKKSFVKIIVNLCEFGCEFADKNVSL